MSGGHGGSPVVLASEDRTPQSKLATRLVVLLSSVFFVCLFGWFFVLFCFFD